MEDSYQSVESISNLSNSLRFSTDKFDVFRKKFTSNKKNFLSNSLNLSSNRSFNRNSMRNSLRNRISKYSSRSRISKNSISSLGSSIDYSLNNSITNPFEPAINASETEYDPIILEEEDNENNNNVVNKENTHFINEYPSKKPKIFLPKFLYFALDIKKQNKILEKKCGEYMNNLEDYYKTIKELEDISINNEQIKNNLKKKKKEKII